MKKDTMADHPVELRIVVMGDTIEHLFMNAADAMADILAKNRYASIVSTDRIDMVSVDKSAALVDFLNGLLAQSHIERAVHIPESVTIEEAEGKVTVQAVMRRYLVPAFDESIKAVAYRDVRIEHKKGKWEATLVFDL
jgi:SHS2 domain-containing protein